MTYLQCAVANGLWYLASLAESLRLRRGLGDIAGTQKEVLLRTLSRNQSTRFGREAGFASIRSVIEFQSRVPLSTYESYCDLIGRIEKGEHQVLTSDEVLMMGLTSGSTAATKHIPYTAALKAEFGRAIASWVVDLYKNDPRLMLGQAYWSVTPVTHQNERTAAGIPIGFEEDSEYFGPFKRYLLRSAMAVPSLVRLIEDIEAFRYVTLLFLLRSRSLALISIWNPTFLTILIERLPRWWRQLADDIANGTLLPPVAISNNLQARLVALNHPNRSRADQIRAVFQYYGEPGKAHADIWPNLRLISCWADSSAAPHLKDLARLFPQARLQGKGLIATEGFVSFPMMNHPGAIPAIRSHFLEFLPAGDNSSSEGALPLLVHELELDHCYEVIVTTGGGLYRYRLHDIVQVVGSFKGCPLIRFVGKEAYISDWFGEKLNEKHVRQSLNALLWQHAISPNFAMVAYDEYDGQRAYRLFIEARGSTDEELSLVGAGLEEALKGNYHYNYCRKLGQLAPLRIFRIDGDGTEIYLSVCQGRGQRLGDIKSVALHRMSGWAQYFRGGIISHRRA
jgi:GH3 auxin-responsive promoter